MLKKTNRKNRGNNRGDKAGNDDTKCVSGSNFGAGGLGLTVLVTAFAYCCHVWWMWMWLWLWFSSVTLRSGKSNSAALREAQILRWTVTITMGSFRLFLVSEHSLATSPCCCSSSSSSSSSSSCCCCGGGGGGGGGGSCCCSWLASVPCHSFACLFRLKTKKKVNNFWSSTLRRRLSYGHDWDMRLKLSVVAGAGWTTVHPQHKLPSRACVYSIYAFVELLSHSVRRCCVKQVTTEAATVAATPQMTSRPLARTC